MDETPRILIVDNDEGTRRTLPLIFGKQGYEIETAATGQEALEKAQERFFNLALLDIKLPDMEGVELIAPLKEMHPDMEVLMVTAYASTETAVWALNEGASAYITKPLNMDEVLATVREALDKQRLVIEKRQAEEERARLAAVIEATSDFVGIAGLDGHPLYLNQAGREMLGIGEDEDVSSVAITDAHPQWARELVLNEGIPTALREGIWRGETVLLTRDGREIPVLQVIVAPRGPEGSVEFHATILRDITERVQAEEQIKRQLQRLAALRDVDMAITASMDMHVTFNVLLDQVTSQLGVDAAAVLLLDPHTLTLEFAAGRGFRTAALQHTQLKLGEGYAGQVALERRIISIPNLAEDENSLKRAPLLPDKQFIAYYGVPLVAKGEVKGVLEVFHGQPLDPDPEWLDFLEALATQAAIAIDNARLFEGLQRSNVDLTLAYDTTLEGWAHALELRDMETEGHSRRVTQMTVRLARAMGLSDEELVHIRRGALLHDIGKMGVPDSILHKPGPLDETEWAMMRKHPQMGYYLLEDIEFLQKPTEIVLTHHERWDGGGYPRGLSGETIPIGARIFAVVDAIDAITSDRPYRAARPFEAAIEELIKMRGTQFDPTVVDAALEITPAEWQRIRTGVEEERRKA